LAGAVREDDVYRIVRPLPARGRDFPEHKVAWSGFQLDGHTRWEVFELVGPHVTTPQPPHVEDVWVRALQPRGRLVPPVERRAILAATTVPRGTPLFGEHLAANASAVYLRPGTGSRSLATLVVPAAAVRFTGYSRQGESEPDIRVTLSLEGFANRYVPVKDHHLLWRVEQGAGGIKGQLQSLHQTVRQMGDQVAIRLGLSRPFAPGSDLGPGYCWLMADGFFSLADPQP
jgi:hypothetical protein